MWGKIYVLLHIIIIGRGRVSVTYRFERYLGMQERHFKFFLGTKFFFIFQCHRTIEKLEKTALHMCLFDIRTNKEIFFLFPRGGGGSNPQ